MSPRKKKVPATRARRPTGARIKKVSAVMRQLGGVSPTAPMLDHDARFEEVVALVEAARGRAYEAVNSELVSLYWQHGEHISRKIASAEWGDGVVEELATELARRYPGLRGFTRPNLFRMRQFYEAYRSMARTTAPTLVAEYQTVLPPKAVLRAKLHELYAQLAPEVIGDIDRGRRPKTSAKYRPSRR